MDNPTYTASKTQLDQITGRQKALRQPIKWCSNIRGNRKKNPDSKL